TLTEAAPVGIFLTEANGDTVFVNETWCRHAGISAEEAKGSGWEKSIHPDDVERVKAEWRSSVANVSASVSEFRFLRPDGTISWMLGHAVPQKDPLGTLIGYVGSCVDVTERHQAQVLMAAQKDIFEKIASHTPLSEALLAVALSVEEQCPGAFAEILLVDPLRQELKSAAAPHLAGSAEPSLRTGFEKPGGASGWTMEASLPETPGIVSGWTMPIHSGEGDDPLGVLSIYFKDQREPSARETHVCEVLAGLAGLAVLRLASLERFDLLTEESKRHMRVYEALLSATPDLAYVFDLDHRFIYANPALLAMWGKTAEEALGKTCLELGYEPWHAAMHDREIEQVVVTKASIRGDVPFHNSETGRRMYDYIFSPVLGADGEVEAVSGTTRDVTDQMESAQRASFLSDLTKKLAAITDEAEIIRLTTAALREKVGSHRCYFVECDEVADRILVHQEALRPEAGSIAGTYRLFDFGGAEWWKEYSSGDFQIGDVRTHPFTEEKRKIYQELEVLSYAVQPYKGEGNTTVVIAVSENRPRHWKQDELALMEDVVARVWPMVRNARSMKGLNESRQQLRLLWETAGIILSVDDPDLMLQGIFLKLRDHLRIDAYFNFMIDEVEQSLALKSIRGIEEEHLPRLQRIAFGQAVCGNVAKFRQSIIACDVQTSGDPRVELVKSMGIRAYASYPLLAGSELLGTLSFASRSRDDFTGSDLEFMQTISHYVTGAYARIRLVDSLRESDRKKDQFLATLAHELRNPLAPILTGLEVMLARPEDGAKVWEVAGMMQRQVGQMVHLIDDLLDMSRVTTGKIVLKKSKVLLQDIVRSALEASEPLLLQYQHQFSVNLPEIPVHLNADPHRIAQVISNLLSNAAKYTPAEGRISLNVSRDGDFVHIAVKDNGYGIDPADQDRIFKLFEQDDHGRNDGLGIGLTLVKSLVDLHEGSISVRSEGAMRGSEFAVRLPALPEEPEAAVETQQAATATAARPRKVLVADDGRSAADVLGMFFQMEGMDVMVTYDGQEAVDAAEKFEPDLVFMDLGMPRMDGFEAARRISQRFPAAKLVALSGWGRDEDRKKSAEAGFTEHLVKPVSPQDLRAALERLGA
ncbi:MAG: chemotaxis protein methyltransferase CheR, partial [Akkermansiaceae bacterium]|nr:chemotaxis protein methyltransferase CheR [Akkermansiaceae bacterium]